MGALMIVKITSLIMDAVIELARSQHRRIAFRGGCIFDCYSQNA